VIDRGKGGNRSGEPLDYAGHVRALAAADPGLAGELAAFQGVEEVLQWIERRGLCRTAVDIVGQDEFSYDFLVQLQAPGRWLAFGVT
jgi:hypothetical protein